MQHRPLGRTGLNVSLICLGTMTWGEQNSEADAHMQMDMALDHGVTFFDAAEMYPVPPSAQTQGLTEKYIGTWFKSRGRRDKVILATKVTGRGNAFPYLGRGETRLSRDQILRAAEESLARLQTDTIDLYQLHWPDRQVNNFGQLGYVHSGKDDCVPLQETLDALAELIKAGKVRHVGLSNETPWGVMSFLRLAEERGLPRMASVQNPYSLLNRSYEVGLAEISMREQCGLLAYSPLAMGVLSGKYLGGAWPQGARLSLFARFQRYSSARAEEATARYVKIAREAGLDAAQMALAFVNRQPFVTSTIIGATSREQLKANIASVNLALPADVLAAIEGVYRDISNPCP